MSLWMVSFVLINYVSILFFKSNYCRGFNKRGELGVGDSITRHSPCKIDVYGLDCGVKKLAAGGHSSALIDELGRLYTWGSIENGRLMLNQQDLAQLSSYGPNNDGLGEFQKTVHVSRPCLVTSLQGCVVFDFAFSKNKSACLVYSQILKVIDLLIESLFINHDILCSMNRLRFILLPSRKSHAMKFESLAVVSIPQSMSLSALLPRMLSLV